MALTEKADFFLEIRLEEMPAGAIPGARAELARKFSDELTEAPLTFEAVSTMATPRRLIVLVTGMPGRQEDRIQEVFGPPASRALDAEGRPNKMAEGFARAQGVGVDDLLRVNTPRGKTLVARRTIRGRTAPEILAEMTPRILKAMTFPKMMRWGSGDHLFVRPVHGIVALFGTEVVPFEVFGVRSGNTTEGHRLFPEGEIVVSGFADYLARIRAAGVEPDGEERASILLQRARQAASEFSGTIESDADLVPTLADFVEWPGVTCGAFDSEFLDLPEEILATTMRVHQKYLPIRDPHGLLPRFVSVMDNHEDRRGFIAKGNEWVLNARLADAKFFYEEDARETLEDRLPRLSRLTVHERLGDYLQKSDRLERLVGAIAELVGCAEAASAAREAARLSKADLTTEMVREFTDLQGVVGGLYARREGYPEGVWKALSDQYRPVSAEDDPPRTEAGALLSLADRFDTLVGFFGIGIIPTGSKDPYGLRRAAQGAVLIVRSRGWRADWRSLARRAIDLYGGCLSEGAEEILQRLGDFFGDRVRFLFERRGIASDVISAVVASGSWDFADLADRARALMEVRRREDFVALSLSVKRIRNILGEGVPDSPDPSLYREEAEVALASDFLQVSRSADSYLSAGQYGRVAAAMTSLAPSLDRFFEEVLVNAPEPQLRANRHALLGSIQREFQKFADISEIVLEK
jgi:glycyl-tRNA synthetase beta chain